MLRADHNAVFGRRDHACVADPTGEERYCNRPARRRLPADEYGVAGRNRASIADAAGDCPHHHRRLVHIATRSKAADLDAKRTVPRDDPASVG